MSNLAATSAVAGGPVHMPTLEDLANDGLKYNEFHNPRSANRDQASDRSQ
jgi:hypothetical protein